MGGAHPELAPIAFLSALSLFLPLPWHWRNGNVATLSIIGWLFLINVIYGVDAVIWANDAIIRIPVWCDITTKLIIGSTTALPAAGLCVTIRLYKACAARGKPVASNPRNMRIWECVACYGVPSANHWDSLDYIVQGHRFDLVETLGCRPALYFSIPGIMIVQAPPILISIIALVYSILALVQIYRHYYSFISSRKDTDTSGNMSLAHYVRLMLMALTQICWVTTVSTICLVFNSLHHAIRPYDSWVNVHSYFYKIWSIPVVMVLPGLYPLLYITWYIVPVSTLIFVALFSFGEDTMQEYRRCLRWTYVHSGLRWVHKRFANIYPNRTRKRRQSVLPPIEFYKPESTTFGTYSADFENDISPPSSALPLNGPVDLEKGPTTSEM